MSRVALLVLLPTIALIAIGVSAYAYYIYNHSVQLREWKGERAVSTGPADVNAGDLPTQPIPKIGVGAPSAPSPSLGTGSVAAIETAKPAPPIESSTAFATSPAGPRTAAATGSNGASSQRPSPSERIRRSRQAVKCPAQQFAAKTVASAGPAAATSHREAFRDKPADTYKTKISGGKGLFAARASTGTVRVRLVSRSMQRKAREHSVNFFSS